MALRLRYTFQHPAVDLPAELVGSYPGVEYLNPDSRLEGPPTRYVETLDMCQYIEVSPPQPVTYQRSSDTP